MDDFLQHFCNISNTPHCDFNPSDYTQYRDEPIHVEQLDAPFTIEEIIKTITSMNRNKSADYYNVVADFFIDAKHFISPYLCTVFNNIYNTGVYPEAWCKRIIVPIHKKGDVTNPSN